MISTAAKIQGANSLKERILLLAIAHELKDTIVRMPPNGVKNPPFSAVDSQVVRVVEVNEAGGTVADFGADSGW
jgi:hypothetical protein